MDSALGIGFHANRNCLPMNILSPNGAASPTLYGSCRFLGCLWDGRVGCCSTVSAGKFVQRKFFSCASLEHSESQPDYSKSFWIHKYHPSEEIREPLSVENGTCMRLTDAETARTLIEVNNKGIFMFREDVSGQEIILKDVPYLTDEHGDIYFKASNDDDFLRNFISEDADDTLMQVLIGQGKIELLTKIEACGPSIFNWGLDETFSEVDDLDYVSEEDGSEDFEVEEDDGENVDDDAYDEDDNDDDVDDDITSEMSFDWSHAETMQATHPIYFARKIVEAVSNYTLDWMDQPSASVLIQGLLRPAFLEGNKLTKKHPFISDAGSNGAQDFGKHIKGNEEGEMDNDLSLHNWAVFFKLEILSIKLVSAYGTKATVKVQDFHLARPDVIAHSAANILSRLKAGGVKTTQALKALCWRHKRIHAEEATIIGLDSLGFDLRFCSGTQIQTLRFAFNTQATSELTAEKQIHDLLFPRQSFYYSNKQQERPAQSRDS